MLIEKDLQKLFHRLVKEDFVEIRVDGSDVMIHFFDSGTKFSLSTSVYYGGNYIPRSVRECINKKVPFQSPLLTTFMTLDEASFKIFINYLGQSESFNQLSFKKIIEEFAYVADEWRIFLDEHDKNDLIYVTKK